MNPIPARRPAVDAPQPRSDAFDRFYHGGKKACDAMDLAISDAIHAKLETADALMRYRENFNSLRNVVELLKPYAESRANAEQIHGWASRSQAAVKTANAALAQSHL